MKQQQFVSSLVLQLLLIEREASHQSSFLYLYKHYFLLFKKIHYMRESTCWRPVCCPLFSFLPHYANRMFAAFATVWCSEPDPHADSFEEVWPQLRPELCDALCRFSGEHRVSVFSWLDIPGQPFPRPNQRQARPHAGGSKLSGNPMFLRLSP